MEGIGSGVISFAISETADIGDEIPVKFIIPASSFNTIQRLKQREEISLKENEVLIIAEEGEERNKIVSACEEKGFYIAGEKSLFLLPQGLTPYYRLFPVLIVTDKAYQESGADERFTAIIHGNSMETSRKAALEYSKDFPITDKEVFSFYSNG